MAPWGRGGAPRPSELTVVTPEDGATHRYRGWRQTFPGEDVTGSVTSIPEKKVNASAALTLAELLRGRVAGLQVIQTATGVTYRLRGESSLYADPAPLVVINGGAGVRRGRGPGNVR